MASKVHTRRKRIAALYAGTSRNRKPRPKTFKTEAAAKKYAEANKIAKYTLVDLKEGSKKNNKIRIVAQ